MKEEKYIIMRNHRVDLLTEYMIYVGTYKFIDYLKLGLKFKFPNCRYFYPSGNIDWPEWQSKAVANSNISNEQYKKLVKMIDCKMKSFEIYLKEFIKNSDKIPYSKDPMIEFFNKSSEIGSFVMYFAFEECIHKRLKQENISDDFIKSSKTDTIMANEEIKKIAKFNKNNPALIDKNVSKLIKRYGYLGMKYFYGHPWTKEEVMDMIKNNLYDKEKTNENKDKIKSETLKIIEKMFSLRTKHWEIMCKAAYYFRKIIINNFPNIEYNKIIWLSIEEVLDALYSNLDYNKIVEKRKNFYIDIRNNGVFIITDNIPSSGEIINERTKMLKGQVAFRGNITGKAKIVLDKTDFSKVEAGNILVATMSTPDYLPVMIKASAFITDIGGVTSHVAIVSREMKKPCIIGTKIATQVLKDGDLVEVDANNGVVRILEKAKI